MAADEAIRSAPIRLGVFSTTTDARTRLAALDLSAIAAFVYGAVLVGWIAADDGGWWPETWAWTALVTLGASVVLLLVRDRALGWLDVAFVGGLLVFGAWTALSAFWSPSVPSTLDEAYRVLAYIGAVLLGLLVVDRRTARYLLGGLLTAIAVLGTYSLATRLLPDRVGNFEHASAFDYRLAEPLTYWNGLAIFLVMGILLALGFAARGETLWTRALAAAALPLLAPAPYFTFSRGGWIALMVGVVAMLAMDSRRLQLLGVGLAIAPFPVLAVWLSARGDGLTRIDATLAEAIQDGHALVLPFIVLAAGSALVAVAVAAAERRIDVPSAARTAFAGVVLITVLGLGAAAWNEWGSPSRIADRLWEDFQSTSTGVEEGDLGTRLFNFSSNGRVEAWRITLDEWRAHPVAGTGAGTYWQSWAAARPINAEVRDAHGLYFETLAELGAVGLVVLFVALLVPIAAALLVRKTPLVPAAFGGYVAWLVHAGADWDWELLGVTLTALLAGVALVASARTTGVPRLVHRWMIPAAAMMLTALALNGVLAYASLASAREALNDLRLAQAAEDARSARRFAPWASAPWEILGDAFAQDDPAGARNAYREALERDGSNWELWLALAAISTGDERRAALVRASALNPLSQDVRDLRNAVVAPAEDS